VSTGARLLKPLPPLRRGRELLAQSAVLGLLAGEGEEKEREAEMKGQERCGTGQCGSQHSRGGGAAGGGNPAF